MGIVVGRCDCDTAAVEEKGVATGGKVQIIVVAMRRCYGVGKRKRTGRKEKRV